MTDKIIISRKEIEALFNSYKASNKDNGWCGVLIADLRELLDKAEVSEPVGYKVTGKLGERCSFKSSEVKKGDIIYTSPPDLEDKLLEANEREAYESSLASSRLIQIAELEAELRQQILECQRLNKLLEE